MDGFDCGVLEEITDDRDIRVVERRHIDEFIEIFGRHKLLNSTLNTLYPFDDPEVRERQREGARNYYINNPEMREKAREHLKSLTSKMETDDIYETYRAARKQRLENLNKDSDYNERRIAALVAVMGSPVECVETGMTFASYSEAARHLRENGKPKASGTAISSCCCGELKSAYGFTWRKLNADL
jgi:hypothetical protein